MTWPCGKCSWTMAHFSSLHFTSILTAIPQLSPTLRRVQSSLEHNGLQWWYHWCLVFFTIFPSDFHYWNVWDICRYHVWSKGLCISPLLNWPLSTDLWRKCVRQKTRNSTYNTTSFPFKTTILSPISDNSIRVWICML